MEVQSNTDIKKLFVKVGKNKETMNAIARPSMTFMQTVWRKFKRNKSALISCGVILFIIFMSIIGPHMLPYDYTANDATMIDRSYSAQHWFGTDTLGRDLWCRTWMGTRASLIIGISVGIIGNLVGAVIGGISGYIGGKIDLIIMSVIDLMYSIPQLIVVILISVALGKGMRTLILALVIYECLGTTRLVRGQVLQLKSSEYVRAAKLLGAKSGRIITKHLIPNTMNVVIVKIVMAVPSAIFMEAFLSFIGLGVQSPDTSLGQLASIGADLCQLYPWKLIIPTIIIAALMLSLNNIGNALNSALDPRQN